MSSALPALLPALARTCGRTGLRVAFSGALAVGLLSTAPTTEARAAAAPAIAKPQRLVQSKTLHRKPRVDPVERALDQAMAVAADQEGDPYVWGATGPDSFDCSGLTSYAYQAAGFDDIPRTAAEQASWARPISHDQIRPGDLMFFDDGGGVYHVGLFAGWQDGQAMMLHAPHSGDVVQVEAAWTDSWTAGTVRGR